MVPWYNIIMIIYVIMIMYDDIWLLAGADGVVIWGGSGDAATVDCEALSSAFDRLGPRLQVRSPKLRVGFSQSSNI